MKKVVLFIVEGITDKISLESVMDTMLDVYDLNGIHYKSKKEIIDRNQHKKNIIESLIRINKVYRNVKYRIFFLSCNLEHVLHNEMDVSEENKIKLAKKFENKYEDNTEGFIDFICKSEFSCNMEYDDSWKFIKSNNNSIKRYTNIDIVVKEYSSQFDV